MRMLVGITSSIVALLFLANLGLLAQGPDHEKFKIHPTMPSGTHAPQKPLYGLKHQANRGSGPTFR